MMITRWARVTSPSEIHLCFHGIGTPSVPVEDEEEKDYWIGEKFFHAVLDLVVGRSDVRLSFDDGFDSDVSWALPALQARGLHATFFPVMAHIDRPGHVSAADVQALAGARMDLGVHGWTHKFWRDCASAELVQELTRSREFLHELTGKPVTEAACPGGSYDRRVLRVLRDLGFTVVHTSDRARARPGAALRPRFSVRRLDTIGDVAAILDDPVPPHQMLRDQLRIWVKGHR